MSGEEDLEFTFDIPTDNEKDDFSSAKKYTGRSRIDKITYYRVTMDKDAPVLEFNMSIVKAINMMIKELNYNYHDLNDVVKVMKIERITRFNGKKPDTLDTKEDVTKEFKDTLNKMMKKE